MRGHGHNHRRPRGDRAQHFPLGAVAEGGVEHLVGDFGIQLRAARAYDLGDATRIVPAERKPPAVLPGQLNLFRILVHHQQ